MSDSTADHQGQGNPQHAINISHESFAHFRTPTTDFTLFWDKRNKEVSLPQNAEHLGADRPGHPRPPKEYVYEGPLTIADNLAARASLVLCQAGSWVSGTCRMENNSWPRVEELPYDCAWKCATHLNGAQIQTADLISAMWHAIPSEQHSTPTGLVIFSGSTNSGKSNVARAFALDVIQKATTKVATFNKALPIEESTKRRRRPHLITYEDPLENWAVGKVDKLDPLLAAQHGFCFTARQQSTDVDTLANALHQARRQTPSCFYIGEVRNESDWPYILDFASTSHLVVVTTHAASLNEMAARLIKAVGATTASDRRQIVTSLLAVFHLSKKDGYILPNAWIVDGEAVGSFVGDGLSSVIPNNKYVLSRRQFLKTFIPPHPRAEQLAGSLDTEELRTQ
jgi:hypothetical protein